MDVNERLYRGSKKVGSCIEFGGALDKQGYGVIWYKTKMVLAHRLSYLLAYGVIDEDLCVIHKCDNPKCINPKHLRQGTHKDNMNDMLAKGRSARGVRQHMSKLNESQVIVIREMVSKGKTYKEIASLLPVGKHAIGRISRRETWRHI